jgi:hypothetical protein
MIKAGDNIVWKLPDKGDMLASILSKILSFKDKSWRSRSWKGWHTGFVVKVLDTGEIVTFQAVNLFEGVCAVTYASEADMGDCKIYHWLDDADEAKIEQYIQEFNGMPYDLLAYFWVTITVLFNWHWSISTKRLMCWQNLTNFDRFMGKELQPCFDEPLISKMMTSLDACQK